MGQNSNAEVDSDLQVVYHKRSIVLWIYFKAKFELKQKQ